MTRIEHILIWSKDEITGEENWIRLADVGKAIYESMIVTTKEEKKND